jgi:pyruvate/2-oxoglutarate dehydrogenase complex dihydrolipoamide acyltransferase (E2) component
MTDKVNVEIPAPAAGVLKEQRAACDDTVAVGAVIAMLETNP